MRLVVLPAVLKAAIGSLSRVMSSKCALPVLDNILLRPSDDPSSVLLTASDGDNVLTVAMQIEEGEDIIPFLLPSDLVKYVRGLSEWPVTVDVDADSCMVTVSDLFGEFSCTGSSEADMFPDVGMTDGNFSVEVPADVFLSTIKAALCFVDKDGFRHVMGGVFCKFSDGCLRVAASNAKTLFADVVPDISAQEASAILARKVVSVADAVFDAKGDPIYLSFDDKHVLVRQGRVSLYGLQIEGRYPRYESVIPRSYSCQAVVDISQLHAAISRANLSASVTGLFRLMFDGNDSLVISTSDVDYSRSGKVTVKTVSQSGMGKGFVIGLRGQYLQDVLSAAFRDCKEVIMMMNGPSHPVVLKERQDSSRLALVTPMIID